MKQQDELLITTSDVINLLDRISIDEKDKFIFYGMLELGGNATTQQIADTANELYRKIKLMPEEK